MSGSSLYINRDVDLDWFIALPFGHVSDGQPEDSYRHVGDGFRWVLDDKTRTPTGFEVVAFSEFDVDDDDYAELWSGPLFDAPLLALRNATAASVLIAAQTAYGDEPTVNRVYFDQAVAAAGTPNAIPSWRLCLESGDSMAHYGLGYTLLDVGRDREAYAHLRYYVDLVPTDAWAWCFLAQAAAAIGLTKEARAACRRALALEGASGYSTRAGELLSELGD